MRFFKIALTLTVMVGLWCQHTADGKVTPAAAAHRIVVYAYNDFVWSKTVRLTETDAGAKGEVVAVRYSPSSSIGPGFFTLSKAEFERIWSTLNAPGVEKRVVSGSQVDLNTEYLFQAGKQTYAVRKTSSAPAVSALAGRLRNHADAALKSLPVKHEA